MALVPGRPQIAPARQGDTAATESETLLQAEYAGRRINISEDP